MIFDRLGATMRCSRCPALGRDLDGFQNRLRASGSESMQSLAILRHVYSIVRGFETCQEGSLLGRPWQ